MIFVAFEWEPRESRFWYFWHITLICAYVRNWPMLLIPVEKYIYFFYLCVSRRAQWEITSLGRRQPTSVLYSQIGRIIIQIYIFVVLNVRGRFSTGHLVSGHLVSVIVIEYNEHAPSEIHERWMRTCRPSASAMLTPLLSIRHQFRCN